MEFYKYDYFHFGDKKNRIAFFQTACSNQHKLHKESEIISKNRFDFISPVSGVRASLVFHLATLNHTWRPKNAALVALVKATEGGDNSSQSP